MIKEKFNITGMSCSSCSSRIQTKIQNLNGIKKAEVNLLTNSMSVEFDEDIISTNEIIENVISLGYGASIYTNNINIESKRHVNTSLKKLIVSIILLIPLIFFSMSHMFGITINPYVLIVIESVFTLAILIINFNYFSNGFSALVKKAPNMNTLIALGATASIIYSIFIILTTDNFINNIYFDGAAMIVTIVSIGKYIESLSKSKTTDAISKLIELTPDNTLVLRYGKEELISTDNVLEGDIVIVKPGYRISVDGEVIEGNGFIDESTLTGESIPVEKNKDSYVYCGTTLVSGYLKIRAQRIKSETKLANIIKLVEEASNSKAKISKTADKVSLYFVPGVMLISLIVLLIWAFLLKEINLGINFAICVLVVSCPCALGLATPTAIMVGTGKAAENGILIKNSVALEELSKTKTVIFDKTGTITEGKMIIQKIETFDISENELIKIAASLENLTDHPLKTAIISYYGETDSLYKVEKFETILSKGINGVINNKKYYIGSKQYISKIIPNIKKFDNNNSVSTKLYISDENKLLGILYIIDKIRDTSKEAIEKLNDLNIDTYLLTGDNEETAKYIQKETNIKNIKWNLMPEDKNQLVKFLSSINTTVMVGDGINDSPALASSTIGVAIGEGSDIAIDSADVILSKNNLNDLVTAILLSKKVIKNIKENLFWAFIYNVIMIPVAAGILYYPLNIQLSPIICTIAMGLSSICVVLNALRLKKFNINNNNESHLTKVVYIEGMHCEHCQNNVEISLNEISKNKSIVNYKNGIAIVSKDTDNNEIIKVIDKLGFKVTKIK